jgi:hypothetical protein
MSSKFRLLYLGENTPREVSKEFLKIRGYLKQRGFKEKQGPELRRTNRMTGIVSLDKNKTL